MMARVARCHRRTSQHDDGNCCPLECSSFSRRRCGVIANRSSLEEFVDTCNGRSYIPYESESLLYTLTNTHSLKSLIKYYTVHTKNINTESKRRPVCRTVLHSTNGRFQTAASVGRVRHRYCIEDSLHPKRYFKIHSEDIARVLSRKQQQEKQAFALRNNSARTKPTSNEQRARTGYYLSGYRFSKSKTAVVVEVNYICSVDLLLGDDDFLPSDHSRDDGGEAVAGLCSPPAAAVGVRAEEETAAVLRPLRDSRGGVGPRLVFRRRGGCGGFFVPASALNYA